MIMTINSSTKIDVGQSEPVPVWGFCFVLFCLPCNSQCACGGMTTAETAFPPSNLWWQVYRGEFSKFSKLLQTLGPPSLPVGQARGAFFRPPNCVFRPTSARKHCFGPSACTPPVGMRPPTYRCARPQLAAKILRRHPHGTLGPAGAQFLSCFPAVPPVSCSKRTLARNWAVHRPVQPTPASIIKVL